MVFTVSRKMKFVRINIRLISTKQMFEAGSKLIPCGVGRTKIFHGKQEVIQAVKSGLWILVIDF